MKVNKYINTKTRAIIETECVIKGGDWEPVKSTRRNKKAEKAVSEENIEGEKEGEEESGE